MFKNIVTYALCIYFLAGNLILPLGDFSLITDLPSMYHSYEKIVSPDEKGVFDFVGDYLLGGKDVLGHNKNDTPQSSGSAVQFQHAATVCSAIIISVQFHNILISEYQPTYKAAYVDKAITAFHKKLFRPPLA